MWTITLRDLEYRWRRFGIAVVGAAVVFALTLVLTGISAGFRHEARETVGMIGADAWLAPRGVIGPFTSPSTLRAGSAREVARAPGVTEAHALAAFSSIARLPGGAVKRVNVIGHAIGRLGEPVWGVGPARQRPAEAIVDERLGVDSGTTVNIASLRLRVVRVVAGRTYFAGTPIVFVGLRDAQRIAFRGRPLASAILVRGTLRRAPPGFTALTNADIRKDLLRPLAGATAAIDKLRLLMWAVAAVIIGAVAYLSALERVRDFAILKAVGGSSRALALSLAAEAILASLLAALVGALVAQALRSAFPVPVTIPAGAYAALAAIAIAVGFVASLAALRRAVQVDPALAFAG
jgi:putative ABC transport system permease protein